MKPIQDIIDIAKVSEYLCNVDIRRKGLYGGGRDLLLPYKINNIRKSVEFLKEYETVAGSSASATIQFSDTGTPFGFITITVEDPQLGLITLVNYLIKLTDTTAQQLVSSLSNAFTSEPYGYTASANDDILTVYAPQDRGSTINGIDINANYTPATYAIGQSYGGGTIAGIDNTGLHGVIIAWNDGTHANVYSPSYATTGATNNDLYGGTFNTNILSALYSGTSAASDCALLTQGGYNDWVLPTASDWQLIYPNIATLGLPAGFTWLTSVEFDSNNCLYYDSSVDNTTVGDKTFTIEYIAVRYF